MDLADDETVALGEADRGVELEAGLDAAGVGIIEEDEAAVLDDGGRPVRPADHGRADDRPQRVHEAGVLLGPVEPAPEPGLVLVGQGLELLRVAGRDEIDDVVERGRSDRREDGIFPAQAIPIAGPEPVAPHDVLLVGALRLMGHVAGHDLGRGEPLDAVRPGGEALPVGRHPVRVEVGEGREALGLLVGQGRVGIRPGQPGPGAEVLVLLAPVEDDIGVLAPERLEDAAAAVPLGVLARGVVVGDPPVVEGEAGRARFPDEGQEFRDPPVLETADAGVGPGIAADLVSRPFRPFGLLEEGQGGIRVGHEFQVFRGGVVQHGLEAGRDVVARRVPFPFPDLLSQPEPEEILPAPGVGVVFEARELAVRRRVEEVVRAKLGRPVHDPLVFLDAFGSPDVDLIVVLAPGDVDADPAGVITEEGLHAVRQGVDLVDVDGRDAGKVPGVVRDELPLGNGLGRKTGAAELVHPDTEAVRSEGAVARAPVHVRRVGSGDAPAVPLPGHERVLEREEQPPDGSGRGGTAAEPAE